MKRNFSFWAMALIFATGLASVSCGDPAAPEGPDGPDSPEVVEPVFPSEVTKALEAGESYTIDFEPNTDWSIELKYDDESTGWFWIQDGNSQVYTLRGKAGVKASVTVCAGDQTDFDTAHSCTLEMKMGDKTRTIGTFTRGTVARTFSLAYCKVEENGVDYVYNEDENSELQYEYNAALEGSGSVIPLEWLGRTKDFRISILISANFDWQLKSKPEWMLDLKITGGEAGKQVELELEGDPLKYPLEDASAELVFCAKENTEAAYSFTVTIPGCADIFSIEGFTAESKANLAGEIYKESAMGDGTWVPAEIGLTGTVLGLEGTEIYTFVLGADNRWSPVEGTGWVKVTLDSWAADVGVIQNRNLNILVDANTGKERKAYVFAVPAGKIPANAGEIFPDGMNMDGKYSAYAVTLIRQEGVAVDSDAVSVKPQDEDWMKDDAMAMFEPLDETQYADLFTMTGAQKGYMLTYTSRFAVEAASSNLTASFAFDDIKFYDVMGNEMTSTASWLSVYKLGGRNFRVEMYPDNDPEPNKAASVWGLDVPHFGAITLTGADGSKVIIACVFNDRQVASESSVSFVTPETVSGASIEYVNHDNMEAMNAKYESYGIEFNEDLAMGYDVALLTYTVEQPENAKLYVPKSKMIMVMPYSGAEWLTYTKPAKQDDKYVSTISMDKPAAGQSRFAMLQFMNESWTIETVIYCFPVF